jgi:hypothetical protein
MLIEHAIFRKDLVDGPAPTHGVIFTEDVVKIAGEQVRYAAGCFHNADSSLPKCPMLAGGAHAVI